MNVRNSYSLIAIGLYLRYLRELTENASPGLVVNAFSELKDGLTRSDLIVSLSSLSRLENSGGLLSKVKELDGKGKIGATLRGTIEDEFTALEKVIYAESRIKNIYVIPQRRYNGDYLLSHSQKLLKDGVFQKLSDIAKFDFTSSCRCLAFGEATASAFHILRATEDVLKHYYCSYIKKGRLPKPMWGPMTSELRAKKRNKPDETILHALDVVRNSYRNPTQHPLARYDIDSAQDLFGVCVDLINKMAIKLNDANGT